MNNIESKHSVGYIISNTGRKLNQRLQQLFHEEDVTPEQWSLLVCLDQEDGITHKDLAYRTEKDPANITRLVDQLERKKLVRRANHPNDRRAMLLYVTEQGRVTAHTLAPIESAFVDQLLSNISKDEVAAFRAFMDKINKSTALSTKR